MFTTLGKMNIVNPKVPQTHISIILLQTYFNFSYFLFICPYRFVLGKNPENGRIVYIIRSHLLQKVFCAVLNFLGFVWLLEISLEAMLSPTIPTGAGVHFEIASCFANIIKRVLILKLFWFDQLDILRIINFVTNEDADLAAVDLNVTSRNKVYLALICFAIMSSLAPFATGSNQRTIGSSDWRKYIICTSRNIMAFQLPKSLNETSCAYSPIPDAVTGVLGGIGFFQRFDDNLCSYNF